MNYSYYRDTDMVKTPTDHLIETSEKGKQTLLRLFVIILLFQSALWLYDYTTTTFVKGVSLTDMEIIGPSVVCPGDMLTFSYVMSARGSGLLVSDLTVWRESPPKTIIFSDDPKRFILGGEVEQKLKESWEVPESYFNYETYQDEPIPPGVYRRYFSISSRSNDRVIAIDSVDFTIPEGCNNGSD